jgi:hypothetical protein
MAAKKRRCLMCGRVIAADKTLTRKFDGRDCLFDSKDCILIFKKFRSLYGKTFFR